MPQQTSCICFIQYAIWFNEDDLNKRSRGELMQDDTQMTIRKKIYYIFHVSGIGGGTLCLYNLVKGLDRTLYEPTVILERPGPLSELLSTIAVPIVYIPNLCAYPYNRTLAAPSSLMAIIRIFRATHALYRLLAAANCHILHINSFMLFPYALASKALGIRTIVHFREHWPPDEHRLQFSAARRIVDSCAEHVLAINENAAKQLSMLDKTTVVYDWIDLNRDRSDGGVSRIYQERLRGKFNFLFIGGMQSSKGIVEVVQAFRTCSELVDCRLIIVGCDGSDGQRKGIRHRATSVLHKLGWKSKSRALMESIAADPRIVTLPSILAMREIYEMAHALVAFPRMPHAILPIAEALSVGLPVIAADLPESREYSGDNNGVIFIPHLNVDALCVGLRDMFKNWAYFRSQAQRGSTKVAARFDVGRNLALVHSVYAGVS